MKADLPENEQKRLDALRSYRILDSLPEVSYDDITQIASQICDTPIAAISFIDDNRQWFKSKIGLEVSETPRDISFCSHAILKPEVLIVPDARQDKRFADNPLVTHHPKIRFYAGAPLISNSGAALGTICVIDQQPRTLSEQQQRTLSALARQVIAQLELRLHIVEQRQQQELLEAYRKDLEEINARLRTTSLADDVSGFHNTRFLHQYLDSYLDQSNSLIQPLSLVFFDMDNFKEVVDRHGHPAGTMVLREVAQTVNHCLDPEDRIVRYGGDEYVVILPHQTKGEALFKVKRMKELIDTTLFLATEKINLRLSASFGLATYPEDAADKRQLLAEADRCLFRSKESGRNRITVK